MVVLPREISDIVKNPANSIEKNPLGILDTICFACEADFELNEEVLKACTGKIQLLNDVSIDKMRESLENIISSKRAGKGLTLLTRTGAMDYILGEEISRNMTKQQMEDFSMYVENIDNTKQTTLRRLALFYKCFNPKKAEEAIKKMMFSEEEECHLLDAIYLLDKIYFLTNKYDMKKFLVKYGMERYEFLHNLSKAQRIIYDFPVNRIHSREYVLDNIKQYNEPIFIEDLEIEKQDLLDLGIPEKDIERIFDAILDITHMKPNLNTKKDLLEYARKFGKNKWASTFRKIKFIK